MNRIFRLIWSDALSTFIAVSEIASARGSRSSGKRRRLRLLAASQLLTLCIAAGTAIADTLPTGGSIVAGSGAIAVNGATMTVTQNTPKMAADWTSFSVGQNNTVNFNQPSSSAVALNRVTGADASVIQGALNANGQVFLVNPNGVLFSSGAQVNVGALVASTLDITNDDFMAGNYRFQGNSSNAIVNQGNITTHDGGTIALIAARIDISGTLTAPNGNVLMGAGSKVALDLGGPVKIQVEEAAIDALIEQGGAIKADGGLVYLTARAAGELATTVINHTGVTEARTLATGERGEIVLLAENHQLSVAGTLDATATEFGLGGRIVASGDYVRIEDSAKLDASGVHGGGDVLVGGSWQNSDPEVYQATGTYIASGAELKANATDTGNGGTVVAWSNISDPLSVTRAYGTFEARGGANGGDGGRIETSGHWLDVTGSQGGASAPKGNAGVWLFDPYNVTITGADANGFWIVFNPDVFSPTSSGSTIKAATIVSKLEGGTSVTVTTNSGGGEIGDITVSSAITKAAGDSDVTLTLQAANSIVVDEAISKTGGDGKLNIVLDADNDNFTRDGGGIILLNNNISTGGGNLSFGTGATLSLNGVTTKVGGDVYVAGTGTRIITTNGGNVTVNGEMIIANTSGLSINTNNGNVTFGGQVNSGNTYNGVSYFGKTWSEALTNAASGSGGNDGDTYLATITSRLENALASRAVNYVESWLGARRVSGISTDGQWRWVTGPEAAADSGKGTAFFTQTGNGVGTTTSGLYTNWNTNEPNNYTGATGSTDYTREYESVLQFTGSLGQWNDLTGGISADATPSILGYYVKETNLATSPLSINAGTGIVTFSGAVGSNKALASLDVTSTNASGIAINGGAVTTTGAQNYTGNVTLGAASTVLTQTAANTNFTIQAGESITNAYANDAGLTIKTTGNINLGTGSSISSPSYKLNSVLWADSDASASGAISLASSTITTNGGHLWMGGGSGSTTWNGLTVGDGSAVNPAGNGITLTSSLVSSGVGNIYMKGQSTDAAGVHSDGIDINYNNQTAIQSTTGSIELIGTGGTLAATGPTPDGIRVSGSILSTTGAISLTGYASTGEQSEAIAVEKSSISSTSGNIFLNGDTFWMDTTTSSVASSGLLTIAPTTVGRTIGIAGGAGGLSLASTYFNTGFVDGFSGITVGGATSGLISVGGSALSYNDPLSLKTGNSIFFSTTSAVTGNNNALILWTRANGNDIANDGVDGSVWMPVGSTINTSGGNVVIGGGSNPTTGYALGDDGGISAENNARWRGATINGTLNAGGGNISILGRGNDLITARGVSIGGAISTSGNGTVTIAGIAEGISDGLALGDSALFGSSVGTVTAVNGTISLSGTKDIGTNGINLSTAGSSITTNGTGNLVMNSTGNINATGTVTTGGTTSLTAGAANNITLNNAANNFTGAVSVASGNNISIIDSNAMTLGAVNAAGTVNIATLTDDLTLTGAIATTNTTADAVQLNAGKNTAAGTATGGNIIVSGGSPTVTVGAGGTAKFYSGSVADSTGLTDFIVSGSGRFRYASDEATTNYSTALSTGINAIYRESFALTVTPDLYTSTYGEAVSPTAFTVSGVLQNGDSLGTISATINSTGTSTSNAGSYALSVSGLTAHDSLGYALTGAGYPDGHTIIKADLTVTADDKTRLYGETNPSFTTTVTGFVNGETLGTSGFTGSGSGSTTATTSTGVGTATITAAAGTLAASNYNFTNLVNGTLTIDKAHLTVTADDKTRLYGEANPSFTTTVTGFVNGETLGMSGVTGSGSGSTTATTSTGVGTATITAAAGTLAASNYNFTNLVNGTLTINAASAPPPDPTPEPTEKQQAAIDSAQNPVLSTNSLDSISTSLAFIKVDSEPTGESDSTNGAASGPPPGREESGFMNVFVVSGGINYPEGVFEEENNNNRRRGVN